MGRYIQCQHILHLISGFTWGIPVGVVGVCVPLLVFLLAGGLLLYCKHTRMEVPARVPARDEDEAKNESVSNDSQQHGSAVDDRANVVHQETG